ncbi:MAG: sugar ABC transporter permease [Lachnospiraceae bacterium]|nr:sugar ABC transporter permease [Lachnospiraceae bacterium]
MKKDKKKKVVGLEKQKAFAGYMFIAPFIFGFLLFMVKPLIQSLYMSFCDVQLGPAKFDMVLFKDNLFENYRWSLRVDPEFTSLLGEELLRMFLYSFAIIVFSLFIAVILNQEFKGRALVRAVFFLPVILSSGVMLGLESNNTLISTLQTTVEEVTTGASITDALKTILRNTGVGVRAYEAVFEVIDNIYDVALASGMQIIIFLSGLQTIPKSMYEAASIEGCTAWESFWKVTFPSISGLFLVNWIYTVVDFSMRSDNKVIDKIQDILQAKMNYGAASAMSWMYFLVIAAYVGLSSLIISKRVYYYD